MKLLSGFKKVLLGCLILLPFQVLYATSHHIHYDNCVNKTYKKLYPQTVDYNVIAKRLYLTRVLPNLCQHTLHSHDDAFIMNNAVSVSYQVLGYPMSGSVIERWYAKDKDPYLQLVDLLTTDPSVKSMKTLLSLDFSK